MSELWLGSAIADITPQEPVSLAGFAHRSGVFEAVRRRLHARVWLLAQEEPGGVAHRGLVIQADVIWWDAGRVAALRKQLQEAWGIAPECIVFNASHTHGGPQTTERFDPVLGLLNEDYRAYMERQVTEAVERAAHTLEPVAIERGAAHCRDIGINRRRLSEDGTIAMEPNPEGVNDTEVNVIRYVGASGRVKGVWFHYTCHPTTTGDNYVSSDYSGAAMEELDRRLGAGVSCFLQGCCGDVRPALVRDGQFYRGNDDDVQRFGDRLAAVVADILDRPMTRLHAVPVAGMLRLIELPFQQEAGAAQLELQLLRIADGLALLAMSGEIVVEYGLTVRRVSEGSALPLGYSNGMTGYIPTARQIAEGGYESIRSAPYFGLPAPFSPSIEALIHEQIQAAAATMPEPQH